MVKKIVLCCLCLPIITQAADLKEAPKCDDKKVIEVLSNAFAQQGKATGVEMTVNSVRDIKQSAHYPNKKIRQCVALVMTNGGNYSANYSIAVQGELFFVQAENVMPISR